MFLQQFFDDWYRPLRLLGKSPRTVDLYEYSIRLFEQKLGRPPTLKDFNDLTIAKHLQVLFEIDKRSPHGVNKERAQLLAMWNFAAKKRMVDEFPNVPTINAPDTIPTAWTREQLRALFQSCNREPGTIAGIQASTWWYAMHCVLWDTGERVGALLKLRWDDLENEWLTVKAEYRKGRRRTMQTRLHPGTRKAIAAMPVVDELIFPWDRSETYIYRVYNRILKRAGLPTDKRSKFHRMRRSVASHLHAAGGDATLALGHSSDQVTRKSYLDPRIAEKVHPSDILFRAG